MSNEIIEAGTAQEVAPVYSPASMLQVIGRAASDHSIDVEKMERLLALQERMMAKQAEIEFTRSLTALQSELPRIEKTGKITHNGRLISEYAKYEDIDRAIRPALVRNGFSLRYNTKESGGKIIITGTLSHRDGHSITDEIPLSIDSSGAKNNVQGVGSTIAYGKRYLVGMLLNLVFCGEDDDAQSAGYAPITENQAEEIKELLRETGVDVMKFLAYVSAPDVDSINAADYPKAIAALRRKKSNTGGGQ